MKPNVNSLKSWALICLAASAITFAADHEPIDTDTGETNTGWVEQEAHCGYGIGHNYGVSDTYLPGSVHMIAQVSALGEEIRFEDGSAWKVSPYDCAQAM